MEPRYLLWKTALLRTRTLVMVFSLATLALACDFIFDAPAHAVLERKQEAGKPGGEPPKSGAASAQPDLSDHKLPPSEMQSLIERYTVDRGSLSRSLPAAMSTVRQTRLKQFYTEWLATLGRLDFDALSQDGTVDYLLFKNHLDYELRQLDIQAKALAETAPFIPFAQTIIELDEARCRMEPVDSPKAATLLNNLNKQIEAARRSVEAGLKTQGQAEGDAKSSQLKKTVAHRAAGTVTSLRNTLRNWFSFYNGYDPIFTWWMDAPYKQMDQALKGYAAFLRERIVGLKAEATEAADSPLAEGPSPEGGQFRGNRGTGGFGQDDQPCFPRYHLEGESHPGRNGARHSHQAETDARLHVELEVLWANPRRAMISDHHIFCNFFSPG